MTDIEAAKLTARRIAFTERAVGRDLEASHVDALLDHIKALEEERDEARNGLMVSEQYRRAYCDGKYKLFAYGGEILEAAAQHLPSGSEGPVVGLFEKDQPLTGRV